MVFNPSAKKTPLEAKYNDMAPEEKNRFRELVCMGCEITITTFYDWIKNPERVSKPYRYHIARLLNEDPRTLFNLQS